MPDISKFPEPWIGQNYENGGLFGKRVLIVGESTHMGNNPYNPYNFWNSNIDMAKDHIAGYKDTFRTKLMRVFLRAQGIERDLIEDFWHSVVFFNYYIPPLNKARQQPNKDQKHQPLAYRLSELKPDLVVALAYTRLWDKWLKEPPENLSFAEAPKLSGARRQPKYIRLDDGYEVLSYGLIHPSGKGFSYKRESPFLRHVIELP